MNAGKWFSAPNSPWVRRAVLAAACAGVIATLILIASSIGSRTEQWSSDPADANFNLLVRGFQEGQLNLKKEVPPGLAKLADPYDQYANQPYRDYPYLLHDMSYHGGKLYLYFGVTPVVVLFWPWAAITGHYLSDPRAAVIFCGVGFLASVGLFLAAWRRYFPQVAFGVAVAGVVALGLADGIPVLLQRPYLYEVEVSCAYAMCMLALSAVFCALHQPLREVGRRVPATPVGAESSEASQGRAAPPRRARWLAAASLFYGLAVGARPALLFGAVVLAIPVLLAWRAAPDRPSSRSVWALAAAAAVPLGLIVIGLLIYNFLRFGNPLMFGQRYQMAITPSKSAQPAFHLRFLWFNLRAYFLAPVQWQARFPFVRDIVTGPIPVGHYGMESPYGVLANVPITWLALAAPLGCRGPAAETRSLLGWFLTATALFFGICTLTLGCYFAACGRYEVDFLPSLMLLAVLGILGLERTLAENRAGRLAARWGWGSLLVLSIAFNLLASFQHHADQYYLHGEMMLRLRRLPEATADFNEALQIRPDYLDARLGLVDAHDQAGAKAEAIAELQGILRQHPDDAEAENRLGCLLVNSGRPEEGIQHLERVVRLNPGFADAENNLGSALVGVGRGPEAVAHFERALRLNPNLGEVQNNLGLLLARLGRNAEAISHFEQALRVRPDLGAAHGNLGLVLARVGRWQEAIVELEQAVQFNPDNADDHCILGVVLGMEGRTPEAISHLERALEIKPGFPAARRALQRLEAAGRMNAPNP